MINGGNANKEGNCLPCKITSIICLCGIGGYLIHQSKIQKTTNSKIALVLLGTGSIAMGIGEIFDKSPFRGYKDNT